MPKVPASPPGGMPTEPTVDPQITTPATSTDDTLANALGFPVAAPTSNLWADLDSTQLQSAATRLGLGDINAMAPDDLGFVATFARGALDSIEGGGDPDNPLIPTDAPTTADHAAPPEVDPSATTVDTPQPASGSGTDASGGVGPAVATPEAGTTSPADVDPNVIPPAAPQLIDIGGGQFVPVDQVRAAMQMQQQVQGFSPEELALIELRRQGLIAPTFVDPMTQAPIYPAASMQQPAVQPIAQPPTTGNVDDDYIDPRAGAEIAQLRAQQQQLIDSQRQIAQRQLAEHNVALERELVAASAEYQTAKGLSPEELDELASTMTAMRTLPAYAQMYEGDPKSAVKAALDNAYWSMPKFRDREMQRNIASHQMQTAVVDDKKAANQGLVSSPGNVNRTPPPPATRDQRDSAMVAAIEAAQRNGELG